MKETAFYACDQCKVLIEKISGRNEDFSCGGKALKKLEANTSEGAKEKHLPVVEQNGSQITVKVGSVFHPMTEEHSIEWVYLETERGGQRMMLRPDEEPVAVFALAHGDRAVAAYAYCNLHGFWKTQL